MTAAKIHLVLAALMGLAGVALLAAAAHVTGTSNVQTAGQMLLFHASLVFGATAARKAGFLSDLMARIALSRSSRAWRSSQPTCRGAVLPARRCSPRAPRSAVSGCCGWLLLAVSAAFAKPRR